MRGREAASGAAMALTSSIIRAWRRLPFTPDPKPTVAVVRLAGVIASDARPGRGGISAEGAEKPLAKAFASKPERVVVAINSPGGAPAQSRMVHDRIRALAVKHELPVTTYIEDVGASGGYMIALSGDEILADPFAIVGSIGVISASFGFQDAIQRLGIERRVHTAGENKSQLDPFRPEESDDVGRLEDLLTKSHKLFVAMVEDRRAGKVTTTEDVFDGRFWLAGDALDLGLIDGIGDLRTVLKDRYGDDVRIKAYDEKKSGLIGRLLAGGIAAGAEALLAALERRALWARVGR